MLPPMLPINPDQATFVAYAKAAGAVVPLVYKLANEGLFVWSAFAALERANPYAFLLESAETGKGGRYSYMGAAPRRLLKISNGKFQVENAAGETLQTATCGDPLSDLENYLAAYPQVVSANPQLPPFLGGVVGYLGYDCVHYFEPVGARNPDLLQVPDMLWMQTDCMAVFDHYRQELIIVKNCYREDASEDWATCYNTATAELQQWLAQIQQTTVAPMHLPDTQAPVAPASLPQSNFTRAEFCQVVEEAKTYIRAGDIFQVVPSQRFTFAQTATPLEIYRNLRRINPSPYMFHLKCADFSVVGSSPELMLSCQEGELLLRPIAGSRPRGANPQLDDALAQELRSDSKEVAEHLMLVDLGRNDLGRVAAIGSVAVADEKFCRIERYSHIMHMVSDVQATLAADKTPFDAARATFPAGTLSGAPKVRAMQIINQLEPCQRNLYGGFAGYISHTGDMLTCIIIRTLVAKDGLCHVQAGGGIVADSQPEKEYEESVNKAMAALRAAEGAAKKS